MRSVGRAALLVLAAALLFLALDGPGRLGAMLSSDPTETGSGAHRDAAPDPVADADGPSLQAAIGERGAVSGRVSRAGRAVPGAYVTVFPAGGGRRAWSDARTGEQGAFRVDAVPAGSGYVLVVEAADEHVMRRGLAVRRDETTDVGTLALRATGRLAVQVHDASGTPIAGARIELYPSDQGEPGGPAVLEAFIARRILGNDPIRATETDDEGRAHLSGVPAGRYLALIHAPGFRMYRRIVAIRNGGFVGGSLDVNLDRGVQTAAGRVLDAAGRGVSGLRVALNGQEFHVSGLGTTRAGGRVELRSPWSKFPHDVLARLPDGDDILVIRWQDEATAEVRATGAAELAIRVFPEGNDEPLVGAHLAAWSKMAEERFSVALGVTGADGWARVTGRAGEFWGVSGFHEETGGFELHLKSLVGGDRDSAERVEAGVVNTYEFRAKRYTPRLITGRVLDRAGRPLSGATVRSCETSWGSSVIPTAVTDEEGRYAVGEPDELFDKKWCLLVTMPGYQDHVTKQLAVPEDPAAPIRVADVRLAPGVTVTGRVESGSGEPVAGAIVSISDGSPALTRGWYMHGGQYYSLEATSGGRRGVTGPDGRYLIRGVRPLEKAWVGVRHSRYQWGGHPDLDLSRGGLVEVPPVVLAATISLTVQVSGPDGRPKAGAEVKLQPDGGRLKVRGRYGWETLRGGTPRTTDARGRATFAHLDPGLIYVVVTAAGTSGGEAEVTLPTAEPVRIELGAAMPVAGRVVDERGRPIPHAMVHLRNPRREEQVRAAWGAPATEPFVKQEVDERGRFSFPRIPPDTYTIEACATFYTTAKIPISASKTDVVIKMVPSNAAARARYEALGSELSRLYEEDATNQPEDSPARQRVGEIQAEMDRMWTENTASGCSDGKS